MMVTLVWRGRNNTLGFESPHNLFTCELSLLHAITDSRWPFMLLFACWVLFQVFWLMSLLPVIAGATEPFLVASSPQILVYSTGGVLQ